MNRQKTTKQDAGVKSKHYTARVTGRNSLSSSKAFSITIASVAPAISTASPLTSVIAGMAYNQTFAATGGAPPYVWSVSSGNLPAGLSMSSDGILSGTPTATGDAYFSVRVTGGNSLFSTKAFKLTIGSSSPTVTTLSPLASGTVSSAYIRTLTASGGVPPYAWSVSAGSLPAGLSLSSDGVIAGMPTGAGTSSFTVRVASSNNQSATKAFSLIIASLAPAITTVSPMTSGTVGVAYNRYLSATGGTTPYTWNLSTGSLPAGLTLSSTGWLNGTPSAPGTSNFTIRVTGGNSQPSTKDFNLTVVAGAPIVATSSPLAAGTVGISYSQTLTASGGTTPHTWAVGAGSLPSGLTLSSSGVISGKPASAASASFTVRVTGGNKLSSTKIFLITTSDATPQEPLIAGVFSGLVNGYQTGNGTEAENMAAFYRNAGFLSLTTKTDGNFTGTLRLEGKSLPIKGKFVDGAVSVSLKRSGKSDAVVMANFDFTVPGKITGNVTTGGNAMKFQALPALPKSSIQMLSGKRYTVILPAPDATLGHGYGTLVAAANGIGTFAGKMADGTPFTAAGQFEYDPTDSKNWLLPIYLPLYPGAGGMVFGDVYLSKTEVLGVGDVTGSLGWLRPVMPAAKMFANGFLKPLDPIGKRYQQSKGISVFTGTSATGNFTVTADPSATVLLAPVEQEGSWPMTNIPLLNKPVVAGLKMTFTGSTGLFKGTFSRTESGKLIATTYDGAVLATPLVLPGETTEVHAGGFFSTGKESGAVEIE